jgi:hypothetical protein
MVEVFFALLIIAVALINIDIKSSDVAFKILFLAVFLLCFYGYVRTTSENRSYKQGQIDALTGKVQYKLVAMPDSTKVWERIREKE